MRSVPLRTGPAVIGPANLPARRGGSRPAAAAADGDTAAGGGETVTGGGQRFGRIGPANPGAARYVIRLDWDTVASQAGAALSLCRGGPLADTGSEMLMLRGAPRLAELRLEAVR
jgi:hypothetical protein